MANSSDVSFDYTSSGVGMTDLNGNVNFEFGTCGRTLAGNEGRKVLNAIISKRRRRRHDDSPKASADGNARAVWNLGKGPRTADGG